MKKNIYVIEDIWYAEAHDDFCSDYDGEVMSIYEDSFFDSFEEAWNYILADMEKYYKNDYRVNDDGKSVDFHFGDLRTRRVRELKKHTK